MKKTQVQFLGQSDRGDSPAENLGGLNPGEGDGPGAEGAMRQKERQESESLTTECAILFPMSHSEKSGMISAGNSCQPYSSSRCES